MDRQHLSRRLGVELSSGRILIQFAPQRQPYLGQERVLETETVDQRKLRRVFVGEFLRSLGHNLLAQGEKEEVERLTGERSPAHFCRYVLPWFEQ